MGKGGAKKGGKSAAKKKKKKIPFVRIIGGEGWTEEERRWLGQVTESLTRRQLERLWELKEEFVSFGDEGLQQMILRKHYEVGGLEDVLQETHELLSLSREEMEALDTLRQRFTVDELKQMVILRQRYQLPNDASLLLKMFRKYLRANFDIDECAYYMRNALYAHLTEGQLVCGEPVTAEELELVEGLKFRFLTEDDAERMMNLKDGFPRRSDDTILLRYVRAKKTVDGAEEALRQSMIWRLETRPDLIKKADVDAVGRAGTAYWHGHDRYGRPCMLVFPGHYRPGEHTHEEVVTYAKWLFERGMVLSNAAATDDVVTIFDMGGVGRKNVDLKLVWEFFKLQGYYPESLHRAYIVNSNILYWSVMKVIMPVMDKKTRSKVRVVSKLPELLEYFEEDQLMRIHGGTSDYVHDWDSYMNPTETDSLPTWRRIQLADEEREKALAKRKALEAEGKLIDATLEYSDD